MKMSIFKKLLGGFSFVLLLLVIIATISNVKIADIDNMYKELLDNHVSKIVEVKNLKIDVMNESNAINNYLLTGENNYIDGYHQSVKEFEQRLKQLKSRMQSQQETDLITNLENIHTRFLVVREKEIKFKKNNQTDELLEIKKTTATNLNKEFNQTIDELVKIQTENLRTGSDDATETMDFTRLFVLILSIVAIILGVGISIIVSHVISKPLKNAVKTIQQVSRGNLTVKELNIRSKDEIGLLSESINLMINDLKKVIAKITDSANYVTASSQELAASAEQSTNVAEKLAQISQETTTGTELQLQKFQGASESVQEMTAGIHQIATSSQGMLLSAEQAKDMTEEGAKTIENVVVQMNQIFDSVSKATKYIHSLESRSEEISNIVELITNIADQTNLLALNAAIEAARAGEHGKGFSVVADEVRKLAEQSKASADQITDMITLVQKETLLAVKAMEEGNQQTSLGLEGTRIASDSFGRISSSIGTVTEKVEVVSSSVEELAAISDQILNVIDQVREISERNVASNQESAAASQEQLATMEEVSTSADSLATMATELQESISKFKV